MYNPDHQYRCTIIRGKSQTDMEDLLPLYANIVHRNCPCTEDTFKRMGCSMLAKALFLTTAFDDLAEGNQKTILNHLTEVAGTLLGLFYPETDPQTGITYIYESESCKYLVEKSDYPTFFKNLCLNFQFPNGAKWQKFIDDDIEKGLHVKPFCYVVKLLFYAQSQPSKILLSKQEIGYYVLNNLDVLRGKVDVKEVYERIMSDRAKKIKKSPLSGSHDWQHIREQFNLLELANVIESDATYLWLNKDEARAIEIFINHIDEPFFDVNAYNLNSPDGRKLFLEEWKKYYGSFNEELLSLSIPVLSVVSRNELVANGPATKTTLDLGNEGEALVFRIEQERVKAYKARLVNKVLLLGKTKGLGYDISSIEADENPACPEFARYIEVKATRRTTEPSFELDWSDSVNITSKEWIAAQQYGEYYNIYRVYFTKRSVIVARINNPYQLAKEGKVEVYPTIYQMNFGPDVIEQRYKDEFA